MKIAFPTPHTNSRRMRWRAVSPNNKAAKVTAFPYCRTPDFPPSEGWLWEAARLASLLKKFPSFGGVASEARRGGLVCGDTGRQAIHRNETRGKRQAGYHAKKHEIHEKTKSHHDSRSILCVFDPSVKFVSGRVPIRIFFCGSSLYSAALRTKASTSFATMTP